MQLKHLVWIFVFVVLIGVVDCVRLMNDLHVAHQNEATMQGKQNTWIPSRPLFFWKKEKLIEAFFMQEKMSGLKLRSISSSGDGLQFNSVLSGSFNEIMDFFVRLQKIGIVFTINHLVLSLGNDAELLLSLDITLLSLHEKNLPPVILHPRILGYIEFSHKKKIRICS